MSTPLHTLAFVKAHQYKDSVALMRIAAEVPLRVHVTPYRLQDANTALEDLRAGRVAGAAVLQVSSEDL